MCFVQEVEVETLTVAECVFLTSVFREEQGDEAVEGEEDGKGVCCCEGPAADVDAMLVLGETLAAALLRCVLSCFSVDPPPFCKEPCLTTFSSSIWVSAVP